jgi:hypothetical protein
MTAPFAPPIGVDLLTQAADYVRPLLDRSNPIGDRLRALWAAVVTARDLAARDVVEGEFLQLARDTGLVADLGSRGDADLRHVISWALRLLEWEYREPFGGETMERDAKSLTSLTTLIATRSAAAAAAAATKPAEWGAPTPRGSTKF